LGKNKSRCHTYVYIIFTGEIKTLMKKLDWDEINSLSMSAIQYNNKRERKQRAERLISDILPHYRSLHQPPNQSQSFTQSEE
jgi:hypothetical protein